ncbi:ABC transporter permease [Bosea sp. (in: a-proteobacteria)]|uniref:ABC transporter permease n=1 Tax=Bosea sp. (in: a-proteobacteria) TaxID=1871050 RepID=UPI002621BEA7|nr:ABC transporter permease [Bosea sp. (in: a-proteobacteria)]MCO5089508.1 ABC transporter permease [Bosea sp. (in: a-proteobacteria)]
MLTFVPTLLIGSFIVFFLQHLVPGGPAAALLGGGDITPEAVEAVNERLGLNRPLFVQYVDWLMHVVRGDLGVSFRDQERVSRFIIQRLEPTLLLVGGALLVALIVGGTLGIWAALRKEHWDGRAVQTLTGVGLSVPNFWLGTLAVGFFGVYLAVIPVGGYVPLSAGMPASLHSVIAPILVMSMISTVMVARHLRSSMTLVLESVHLRTAQAMGLRPHEIYLNYALRIAVAPLITFLPLVVSQLVGSTVVAERIFNIPGLGSGIVQAVNNRDYPTIQGVILVILCAVTVLNLAADLALNALDPRIRQLRN